MNDLLRLPLVFAARVAYAVNLWRAARDGDPRVSLRTAWDVACILRETPAQERAGRARVRAMLRDLDVRRQENAHA